MTTEELRCLFEHGYENSRCLLRHRPTDETIGAWRIRSINTSCCLATTSIIGEDDMLKELPVPLHNLDSYMTIVFSAGQGNTECLFVPENWEIVKHSREES